MSSISFCDKNGNEKSTPGILTLLFVFNLCELIVSTITSPDFTSLTIVTNLPSSSKTLFPSLTSKSIR
ncbi:Uncharacterised protein [Chlamydia trachomatis]|nr:Uncharacterised protein [Chlamydia trachomatis]